MNVWRLGGRSLIALDELAEAVVISGRAPERCAYLLRALLDDARERGDEGRFSVDLMGICETIDCAAVDLIWIFEALQRARLIVWRAGPRLSAFRLDALAGTIARWPEWRVERTLPRIS